MHVGRAITKTGKIYDIQRMLEHHSGKVEH